MSENESNLNNTAVPHRRGKAGRRDEFAERLGPKLYRAIMDHARSTREPASAIWTRFRLADLNVKPRTFRNRITLARRGAALDALHTPVPRDIRSTLDARAAARVGELIAELSQYIFPGLRDTLVESLANAIGRRLEPVAATEGAEGDTPESDAQAAPAADDQSLKDFWDEGGNA